jgi:hypothetical protein
MVLGVDDLLAAAMAASTTYVAWQRVDAFMDALVPHMSKRNRRRVEADKESPSMLLGGFEVEGENAPILPHSSRFDGKRSILTIAGYDARRMAECLPYYHDADVARLFRTLRRSGGWHSALNLSRAVDLRNVPMRPEYVEATLETLLRAHKPREAAMLYNTFGASMPMSTALLTAVVVGCSNDPTSVAKVISTAGTSYSPVPQELLCAAVSSVATCDWASALKYYGSMQGTFPEAELVEGMPPLEPVGLSHADVLQLLVPACVHHGPSFAGLMSRIAVYAPNNEDSIKLRLLETPEGIKMYQSHFHAEPTWKGALALYLGSPTPTNAVSAISVLTGTHLPSPHGVVKRLVAEGALSQVQANAVASLVARPHNTWRLSAAIGFSLASQSHAGVIGPLVRRAAAAGAWSTALKMLTMSVSKRGVYRPPTSDEVGLAIHASVATGMWSSALFWVERAHGSSTKLNPSTYDAVFRASQHGSWEGAVRIVRSMRGVGDNCSADGIRDLLAMSAQQRRTKETLELLTFTQSVHWQQ